jgi:hypothetical protein
MNIPMHIRIRIRIIFIHISIHTDSKFDFDHTDVTPAVIVDALQASKAATEVGCGGGVWRSVCCAACAYIRAHHTYALAIHTFSHIHKHTYAQVKMAVFLAEQEAAAVAAEELAAAASKKKKGGQKQKPPRAQKKKRVCMCVCVNNTTLCMSIHTFSSYASHLSSFSGPKSPKCAASAHAFTHVRP